MSDQYPARPAPTQYRPTWWMLALSFVAGAGLFIQSPNHHPAIILLTIGTLLAYFLRFRLPAAGVFPWILRGTLLMLLIFLAPERKISARFWYLDESVMSTIGMCLLAELMVQHWLPYLGRMRLGQMLVAAAGVMATATSTTDPRFMAFLAPLYTLATLGVLRHFKPEMATSPAENTPPPPRTSRRWLLQGISLVLAMTLGFLGIGMLHSYQRQLAGLGGQWLANLAMGGRAGISGNEQLGRTYNFGGSPSRTLKITGTNRAMHLKGLTFDTYSRGAWIPSYSRRKWDKATSQIRQLGGGKTFEVQRLADALDLVFLPYNTPGFLPPDGAETEVEPGHRAAVRCVSEKSDVITYTVALPSGEFTQGPLCRQPTDEEKTACLQIPEEIDPRVGEIAAKLKRDDPQATIRAVISYLHENHKYSLSAKGGGDDPVSDFLINKRDAHCQFFAASATMLLRYSGIPCRYVTGYFAWEADGPDAMVVRQRDAHAWAEAWIDPIGWVTVEATPASGTPDAVNPPVNWFQKLKDRTSDFFSAVGQFVRSLRWIHIAITGGIITAIAVSIQLIQSYLKRRKKPRIRSYTFPAEEYRRLATEFESMLRRMGDIPSSSATWSEHLSDQQAQTRRTRRHEKIEAARQFVHAYNRTRFGRPDDQAALEELHKLLQQIKE